MKRHDVMVAIRAKHSNLEISQFFNDASLFVGKRRKHKLRSDIVRTPQFVQQVQDNIVEDPSKSIRAISRDLQVYECTIRPRSHPVKVQRDAQRSVYVCTNSAHLHKAMTTQDWMSENLYNSITSNIRPPSSPDLNPLDYYVRVVVERETNKHPHNTLHFLIVAIPKEMTHIDEDHLIWACKRFRQS